jgi:hypothetical protein
MVMAFRFDKNPLCWTSVEGGTFARKPTAFVGEDTIYWQDMTHVRAFNVKRVLRNEPNVFEFEDDVGRRFALRPLTLEKYAELKSRLNSPPDIRTDAQLRKHFLKDTLVQ